MATRLTPFSRLLIVVLILAAIIFGGRYLINKGTFGDIMNSDKKEATDGTDTKITQGKALPDNGDVLNVQFFTFGNAAPGLYFNNGTEPNENSR